MKNLVQSLFGKLGYRITKLGSVWRPDFGLDSFFNLLKNFDFAPRHIIDVGANKGHWTRTALRYFPASRYTLIEPQDRLKIHIQDLLSPGHKITWVNAGAGDRSGTLPFALAPRDDSSRFIPDAGQPTPPGFQQIVIPVVTLNEVVAGFAAPPPEMVKIDAEGFDLKVLAGASDLLGHTDIFLVEACICSHDGENTAAAVIDFMDRAGYRLIDITDLNRSPAHQVLWLAELVFLRKASPLFDRVTSYE
jgi:FkbM family methyltransferase